MKLFDYIAILLSFLVVLINLILGSRIKKIEGDQNLFVSIIFLNSIFDIVFWVLPKYDFLRISATSLYRLCFFGFLILNYFSNNIKWEKIIAFVVFTSMIFSFIIKKPFDFVNGKMSMLFFAISAYIVLFKGYIGGKRINRNSFLYFLLFSLFISEILFEILKLNYVIINKQNNIIFHLILLTLLITSRLIFVFYHVKQVLR